jgi:hypothetical protein
MANRQASAKAGRGLAAIGAVVPEARAGTLGRVGQDRIARWES